MASDVTRQIGTMMKWRTRALPVIVLLLGLNLLELANLPIAALSPLLGLLSLIVLLPAAVLILMVWAMIFQAGWSAFGWPAGLGYTVIAVLLTPLFGLGIFVVPDMIRLDVRRLLGDDRGAERS